MEVPSDRDCLDVWDLSKAWVDRVPTLFAMWLPQRDDRPFHESTDRVHCCTYHGGKFHTSFPPHLEEHVEVIATYLRSVTNAHSA